MIWNVVETVNPGYSNIAFDSTPFWFLVYDENHTKLYKFGMKGLRRKRLTRKFIETLVHLYSGNNMRGAAIEDFMESEWIRRKYKVEK